MEFLQAVILGILEGLTEFLPVSSTAHLILAAKLLNLSQTEFLKSFEIAIQLGAILSVIFLYSVKVLGRTKRLLKIAVAVIPTAVVGFILYRLVKDVLFENIPLILTSLILGGVVMILIEWRQNGHSFQVHSVDELSYWQAFIIGLAQSLAIIPGVSRAGATIMGGLLMGIERKTIIEFSFLIAVPTMAGAVFLDVLSNGYTLFQEIPVLFLGMVVSFVAALVTIRWLIRFVSHHSFTGFGVYRIIVGLILWGILYL
jgi:undecaprenyl-diphosphatase